ncbi:MAG: OadG family protein [Alistipes sp.]|nr:OadG family protein [Alistipes sp.]
MLLMALIGFVLVFVVLVLLIYIMKAMGWVFTRQKKAAKVAEKGAAADVHDAISDQEIAAAIITALKLYKSNLHDRESEMLTINRITRAYSPWNSKIHGLTQVPERK